MEFAAPHKRSVYCVNWKRMLTDEENADVTRAVDDAVDPAGTGMRRMAKIKCKPVGPGEWVQPRRNGYLLQCCDCDLIHSLDFRLAKDGRGNFIQFRAYRVDKNGKRILGTGDATGKEKI